MQNKVCGECKYFDWVGQCDKVIEFNNVHTPDKACSFFEPLTNGGKIIAGGNKALVNFHLLGTCDTCIYYNKEHTSHNDICLCPKDKTCADGIEAWLNAPADCVKQNGNHDTQPGLSKADDTESEGKNETE